MALFNLSPGPELQPLLEMVQEAHVAGEANTKEEALTMVSQALGKEPVTSPITSEVQDV
jgi:hypothetical protein